MLSNEEYLNRIKRSEGLLKKPRRCPAGFLSIGYGFNLERYGSTPEAIARAKKEVCKILGRDNIDDGISEAEARKLLQHDLDKVIAAVKADKRLGPLFEKLDDERQFVLIDMCYNMGVDKVKKFNNMLTAMENGDYDTAAREIMKSKYAKDVGRRARDNAACMQTGIFEFNTTHRVMKTDRANATQKSKKEEAKAKEASAKARRQPAQTRSGGNSGKILNVGDSRTVGMAGENGMSLKRKTDKSGDRWYAQGGVGLAWFKKHLNNIKQDAADCDCVVVNLGFNDVFAKSGQNVEQLAKQYATQMNELAAEMKRQGKQVYFTTVGHASSSRSDAAKLNKTVDEFNRYVQQYLSDDVKVIDTSPCFNGKSNNHIFGSRGDGIHYTGTFYAELQQYIEQEVRNAEAGRGRTYTPHKETREQPPASSQTRQPETPAPTQPAQPTQSAPAQGATARSSRPRTDTSISAGDERRMRSMLNNLNRVNGKSRQVDVDATIEALSAQYGADADRILAKAMMAPATVAKKLNLRDENGRLITSSRKLIQRLCEMEDEQQKQSVIAMAKTQRRRRSR